VVCGLWEVRSLGLIKLRVKAPLVVTCEANPLKYNEELADFQRNPERFLPRMQRETTPGATRLEVRYPYPTLLSKIRMPVPVPRFTIKLITNRIVSIIITQLVD